MKVSRAVIILSICIIPLTLIASGSGLFRIEGGNSYMFTTIQGEEVEIYGRGLYHLNTSFRAPILRGTDAILLFIGLPLLVLATFLYKRGSLQGGFLLTGLLACFLYNAISVAFGAVYNSMYLLYLLLFSVSLFAFILAFGSINLKTFNEKISAKIPYCGIAIFIFIAGLSPSVWLVDIIFALLEGGVPQNLAHYTTDVTTLLDVGVITPSAFLASVLMLRRKPMGVLLSSTLLILLTLIGLIVVAQSIMQIIDEIRLSTSEFALFVVPFVTLSLIAAGLNVVMLRNIDKCKSL